MGKIAYSLVHNQESTQEKRTGKARAKLRFYQMWMNRTTSYNLIGNLASLVQLHSQPSVYLFVLIGSSAAITAKVQMVTDGMAFQIEKEKKMYILFLLLCVFRSLKDIIKMYLYKLC